ncbi:NifU family protein [Microlunatus elymi]|uniref:NifU family protein n=1 Tax=Microlunatus elymi TaxID=2596828 RepID=A0A516Q4W0_9ACTN|nr:NifU family protein [Microlunatus elymi]QDP98415.1 NifU family protein [Microlunatus elymi]
MTTVASTPRSAPVPMHPEPVQDAPDTVRWIIPSGIFDFAGPVAAAPGAFGRLLADRTVAAVIVEAGAVRVRLAPPHGWAELGGTVRDGLQAALEQPAQWQPAEDAGADGRLRAALAEVLAGPVGDYIGSHGGRVEIVEVADRRAVLKLSGTCSHCPAAGVTLHERLETAVRELFPELVELRAEEAPARRGPRWLTLGRRSA